jgi:hypothetical protein
MKQKYIGTGLGVKSTHNQYDLKLEAQWESAITECRKHTYFINPNNSILFGFFLIINLVFIFLLNIVISNFVNIDKILFVAHVHHR